MVDIFPSYVRENSKIAKRVETPFGGSTSSTSPATSLGRLWPSLVFPLTRALSMDAVDHQSTVQRMLASDRTIPLRQVWSLRISRSQPLEMRPEKRIDADRFKLSRIFSTAPNDIQCSEILARAQLGEPLLDRNREALRKECQS